MYEILIIISLILINGLLAMSEIAFVSARKFRLEEMAKKGNNAAKKALYLLKEPERFLSAVQIGITLVGILAGAFGGYALAEDVKPLFTEFALLKAYAAELSFATVVIAITYLSLVIGELVPKTIALNNPEKITILTAPLMYFIAKAFAPLVWLLSASTKFISMLTGIKTNDEPPVSEDELKSLLELGRSYGTFDDEESEIIKKVFRFNDKRVKEIMIPRTEIEWLDISLSNKEIFHFIDNHNFSRFIVCDGDLDNLTGVLESREFLLKYSADENFNAKEIIQDALVVPDTIYSIELFRKFQVNRTSIAVVVDEYGGTQGLITLHDLVENIFGEIPDKFDQPDNKIINIDEYTILADGTVAAEKLSEILSLNINSDEYTTIGGFIMNKLGKIPEEGDSVKFHSYTFRVKSMDGNRVKSVVIIKNK